MSCRRSGQNAIFGVTSALQVIRPATALFLLDLNLGKGSFEPEKLLYIPSAVVSWWNGDTHLPFCFCQTEAAITFPACFLPLQVASWVAV